MSDQLYHIEDGAEVRRVNAEYFARVDGPALIAEIRRLRAALTDSASPPTIDEMCETANSPRTSVRGSASPPASPTDAEIHDVLLRWRSRKATNPETFAAVRSLFSPKGAA